MYRHLAVAFAFFFSSPAFAACDVESFIFDDKIIYTADDVVRLSLLTEAEDFQQQDQRDKVDGAALVPGYFQAGYSEDSRRSMITRQHRMLGLELTQIARRTLIQSHLSDNSARMYEACLNANGLMIQAPAYAKDSPQFFVEIHYKPGPGVGAADMFVAGRPRIVVSNGAVPPEYWPFIPKKIQPGEKTRILIHRDVTKFTEIAANIGFFSDSVILPPEVTTRIEFSQRTATDAASAWRAHPYDAKTICVTAGSDEVLFPETATISKGRWTPQHPRNKAEIMPGRRSEFEVCALVEANTDPGDDFTGGFIEAFLTVVVAKVVPKDAPVQPTNLSAAGGTQ